MLHVGQLLPLCARLQPGVACGKTSVPRCRRPAATTHEQRRCGVPSKASIAALPAMLRAPEPPPLKPGRTPRHHGEQHCESCVSDALHHPGPHSHQSVNRCLPRSDRQRRRCVPELWTKPIARLSAKLNAIEMETDASWISPWRGRQDDGPSRLVHLRRRNGESAPPRADPTGKRSARKRACSVWLRKAVKPYLSLPERDQHTPCPSPRARVVRRAAITSSVRARSSARSAASGVGSRGPALRSSRRES